MYIQIFVKTARNSESNICEKLRKALEMKKGADLILFFSLFFFINHSYKGR